MPKPGEVAAYGPLWPEIVTSVNDRAMGRCECVGQCGDTHDGGRCGVPHAALIRRRVDRGASWVLAAAVPPDDPSYGKPARVRAAVAHLDHDIANHAMSNLALLCSRCHILLDRDQHRESRKRTDATRAAILNPKTKDIP